jgi:hypothetical protein
VTRPPAFSTYSRAVDGAIVQFVSEVGERRTIVAQGIPPGRGPLGAEGVEASLLRAIEQAEGWPGSWKVEVISTPSTILRDLRGSRRSKGRARITAGAGDPRVEYTQLVTPEMQYLGQIGRMDMLAR